MRHYQTITAELAGLGHAYVIMFREKSQPQARPKDAVPMVVIHDGVDSTKVRTLNLDSPEDQKLLPHRLASNYYTEENHRENKRNADSMASDGHSPQPQRLSASPVKIIGSKFSPMMGRSLRFRKGKLTFEEKSEDVHPDDDKSSFFARVC